MFQYPHRVQFYETDLMGIVHHSNYLRFFEEARVAWAHDRGLLDFQRPETASHLAVIETRCRHLKPCFFGDDLSIRIQAKREGIRILFQYQIQNETQKSAVAVGMTSHAALDYNLKLMRLPKELREKLENERWTETWLSNL